MIHFPESWESFAEFIRLIRWAFFPPDPSLLLEKRDAPGSRADFAVKVSSPLPDGYSEWIIELKATFERERQRMQQIEMKASNLLGQNALIVSMLSIGTALLLGRSTGIPNSWMLFVFLLIDSIIIVFFVCAILWSRNAIILHYGLPNQDYSHSSDDFITAQVDRDREMVIDLLYLIEHWGFIADVKGTRVRIAHDFLRTGFFSVLILLVGILLASLTGAILVSIRAC